MEGIIGKEQGPADDVRFERLMEAARKPIEDLPVHGVGLVTILPDGSKTVERVSPASEERRRHEEDHRER